MNNDLIIKELKLNEKVLKSSGHETLYTRSHCFGVYTFNQMVFIKEKDSCFNKCYQEIQFKTINGLDNFIDLFNKEFKSNIKHYEVK